VRPTWWTARLESVSRIARVGSDVWPVGNSAHHVSTVAGHLFLRVNDCDEGLYDNAGELEVKIVRDRTRDGLRRQTCAHRHG
jgi:hypothetical protein